MPLKNGYSRQTIKDNIAQMLRDGYPHNQSVAAALNKARAAYVKRFPQGVIPNYLRRKVDVPRGNASRNQNPVPLSKNAMIARGVELFKNFRGEEPEYVDTVQMPCHAVAMVIGECDGVLYTTRRDGKIEQYIHKFKGKSRPLLCTSYDGSQLYLLGGAYDFTDAGITDRIKEKSP